MARRAGRPRRQPGPRRLHEAAWPDLFANLQAAYAELTRAQVTLERRATEVAEARDLFQRVVESMSEALFLLDRGGRVVRANPAAGALLGCDAAELAGKPLAEVCGSDAIPATPWRVLARAPGGTLPSLEVEITPPAGRAIPLSVSCGLVRDQWGKITGVLVVARDMRETRRLIGELQAALRIREQFLTIASHELKTPLAVISGYTELLQRALDAEAIDPERARRAVTQLAAANHRLRDLVDELLDVGRLQAGQLALRREATDLVALVAEVAARARATASARHTIRLETAVAALRGHWDRGRLDQVLTNLLDNAVKYSPHGGEVTVAIAIESGVGGADGPQLAGSAPSAVAVVRVTDQGVGVPPEQGARLFELFYRAANVVERDFAGLGVGLYLSREIARRHGGELALERSGPQGSTFCLRLPVGCGAAHDDRGGGSGEAGP